LFQDRYKSEPIEDDSYFLTVLRYIHQNPQKAKMCKKIDEYKWSSYHDYIRQNGITDTAFAFGILDTEEEKAREIFINYNNDPNDDKCLEIQEQEFRMTDDEARKIIYKVSKAKSLSEFQIIEIKKWNSIKKKLKQQGLSIRQIARLTGASFGIVRNI
jgi:putative transposase